MAALVGATSPARAGEGTCAGAACVNECPLAQQANERRSFGGEAVLASKKAREEAVRVVLKNLSAV
jgi:hypothetical protein